MNSQDITRYEMFQRVIVFRDARTAQFQADTKAAQEFAIVETSLADIDAAEDKQSGGTAVIGAAVYNLPAPSGQCRQDPGPHSGADRIVDPWPENATQRRSISKLGYAYGP